MKKVGIIMGSKSDLPVMQNAIDILQEFGIETKVNIVSAHRTPEKMFDYANNAKHNNIGVIIAPLPVIGVPVKSRNSIDGWDSMLSILQMPDGVPVATVALNGAKNAGILAAQILGVESSSISLKISEYKESLKSKVIESDNDLENS